MFKTLNLCCFTTWLQWFRVFFTLILFIYLYFNAALKQWIVISGRTVVCEQTKYHSCSGIIIYTRTYVILSIPCWAVICIQYCTFWLRILSRPGCGAHKVNNCFDAGLKAWVACTMAEIHTRSRFSCQEQWNIVWELHGYIESKTQASLV